LTERPRRSRPNDRACARQSRHAAGIEIQPFVTEQQVRIEGGDGQPKHERSEYAANEPAPRHDARRPDCDPGRQPRSIRPMGGDDGAGDLFQTRDSRDVANGVEYRELNRRFDTIIR